MKRVKADRCTPEHLCVRCSMVKVIAHRFAIFRETFDREPLPSEPLFFVAGAARPIPARQQELRDQLSEAAEETNVSLGEILEFLGVEEAMRS